MKLLLFILSAGSGASAVLYSRWLLESAIITAFRL
jgi:hypothetical protein